jgi:hypothetical protein
LLAGDVVVPDAPQPGAATVSHSSHDGERLSRLEEEVSGLRKELTEVKAQLETFRKQFE